MAPLVRCRKGKFPTIKRFTSPRDNFEHRYPLITFFSVVISSIFFSLHYFSGEALFCDNGLTGKVTGRFGPIPVRTPGRFGPIPFRSGRFGPGRFGPS